MKITTTNFPAKLFIGIMFSDKKNCSNAIEELKNKFGDIEVESQEYEFSKITDYYAGEMGKKILKKFIVFKNLINKDQLANIKIFTNMMEEKYSIRGKRKINLDPGYFDKDQLVLASVKSSPYKVYIGNGIYAHLTFLFKKNDCIEMFRTFPDFRSDGIKKFFINLRKNLYKQASTTRMYADKSKGRLQKAKFQAIKK